MKPLRILVTSALVVSVSLPALAQAPPATGPVTAAAPRTVLAQALAAQAQTQVQVLTPTRTSSGRALTRVGAALFVGGMAVGLYGFIHNRNGEFSEFGEAASSNKVLGTAGLVTAFGGGALMFMANRMGPAMSSLDVSARGVSVSRRLAW